MHIVRAREEGVVHIVRAREEGLVHIVGGREEGVMYIAPSLVTEQCLRSGVEMG